MQPRVLINAKWRTHPRVTGVQRYAAGLTRALRDAGVAFDEAAPSPGPAWRTTLWEQHALSAAAQGYDLLLCPANSGPARLGHETRLLLTLHCLRFRVHPENYTRGFVRWYEYLIPRLVRRADAIITVSHTAARELGEAFPEALGKLHAIHPGIDEAFTPVRPRDPALGPESYCVFVGNPSPAKNLRTLLMALERTNAPVNLVLVGVDERQKRLICPDSLHDRVLAVGHINDPARVASVLAHARALLAPSHYESFDLPIAEAMACACPVLASDLPVHREIGADAARYIPATDAVAWALAIDRILAHPGEARALAEAGRRRASRFSWSRAAKRVTGLVQELTGVHHA